VNIVPLSPLTITLRAKTGIHTSDELQAWRWLASKWWGKIRPDITIHVQDAGCMPNEAAGSVEQHMNTFVIVKSSLATGSINGISPKQLRRIVFEIRGWLIFDTAT